MKFEEISIVVLAIIVLAVCGPACATVVLTFDDITSDPDAMIPNGYGGFNWGNLGVLDSVAYIGDTESGYFHGRVSGNYVAANPGANMAVVYDSSFDFIGAYLTAAWRTGLNIDVKGYRDSELVYSQTVIVDYSAPTWFQFNFTNIDTITFDSYGGTEVPGLSGNSAHFAMDNFTVPEPGTVLLLGMGGLVLMRKHRA